MGIGIGTIKADTPRNIDAVLDHNKALFNLSAISRDYSASKVVRQQMLSFHDAMITMRNMLIQRAEFFKFDQEDPTSPASSNYLHRSENNLYQNAAHRHEEPAAATGSSDDYTFLQLLASTPFPIYKANGPCQPEIGPLSSVLSKSLIHSQVGASAAVQCNECGTPYAMLHLKFDFCTDGVKLGENRAKNKHSWPWFASLIYISPCVHRQHIRYYMPSNIAPVIFGFFHGAEKPHRIDEMIRPFLIEMILAKHFRICTLEPRFFIGDGPGRAYFRSSPAANADKGCEG